MKIRKIDEKELNRREFIRKGALVAAALPAAGAAMSLWGCTRQEQPGGAQPEQQPPAERMPPAGGEQQAGDGALKHVTEYPSNKAVLQALKYVEKTATPGQRCDNCQFYAVDAAQKNMGKCQLIPQGLVKAEAWCASWQKKAA